MVGQIGVTTDLTCQIQLLVISTIKTGFLALWNSVDPLLLWKHLFCLANTSQSSYVCNPTYKSPVFALGSINILMRIIGKQTAYSRTRIILFSHHFFFFFKLNRQHEILLRHMYKCLFISFLFLWRHVSTFSQDSDFSKLDTGGQDTLPHEAVGREVILNNL